jgi:ankyrin repeat protein
MLLQHKKINITLKDKNKKTALDLAKENQHHEITKMISNHKTNPKDIK